MKSIRTFLKALMISKKVMSYFFHSLTLKERSSAQNNSVALFSQGLDSINTVINNLDKNLSLLTLHGSDIPLDKTEG